MIYLLNFNDHIFQLYTSNQWLTEKFLVMLNLFCAEFCCDYPFLLVHWIEHTKGQKGWKVFTVDYISDRFLFFRHLILWEVFGGLLQDDVLDFAVFSEKFLNVVLVESKAFREWDSEDSHVFLVIFGDSINLFTGISVIILEGFFEVAIQVLWVFRGRRIVRGSWVRIGLVSVGTGVASFH